MQLSITKEVYDRYCRRTVIPVVEKDFDEFAKTYDHVSLIRRNFTMRENKPYGMAMYTTAAMAEVLSIPKVCIMVESRKCNLQKLYTVWHEEGHFVCYSLGCACDAMGDDFLTSEVHADMHAFEMSEVENIPQVAVFCMKEILRRRKYNTSIHAKAAEHIMEISGERTGSFWQTLMQVYGDDLISYVKKIDATLLDLI